jgi:hypothetical protein
MGFRVLPFQCYNSSCFGAWNLKYHLFKIIDAIDQSNFNGIFNATNINTPHLGWGGERIYVVDNNITKYISPWENGTYSLVL